MRRFIIVISLILSSCSENSKNNSTVFSAAEEGLDQSNIAITKSTRVIYYALDEKLKIPETAEKAHVWQPSAMVIKERSEGMVDYIALLIKKLKDEAGFKSENDNVSFKKDDIDAVTQLFVNEKNGDTLYQKLQQYRLDILAVNPNLFKEFGRNSIITTRAFELKEDKQKDFTKTFFYQVTAIGALATLRKFENNVRVLENKFVTYCYNQIGSNGGSFTLIEPVLALSSSYVKAGDKIEMHAGIGSFSNQTNPVFIIDNKVIQPDENGVAVYKINTSGKAGKYFVPVKIEFTRPDGGKDFFTKKLEYTVVE